MTNPYLNAAQEVVGQSLISPSIRGLNQNPYLEAIPTRLPQAPAAIPTQLGNFGSLTAFSKIRKMLFLTTVGAGFAISLMYSNKLENLLLAENRDFDKLRALLPKLKKTALPVAGLFSIPTVLALFTDKEWPMVGWICWLVAIAYFLKETGGDVYSVIRDSNEAGEVLKENKLVSARKRARKKS